MYDDAKELILQQRGKMQCKINSSMTVGCFEIHSSYSDKRYCF